MPLLWMNKITIQITVCRKNYQIKCYFIKRTYQMTASNETFNSFVVEFSFSVLLQVLEWMKTNYFYLEPEHEWDSTFFPPTMTHSMSRSSIKVNSFCWCYDVVSPELGNKSEGFFTMEC